MQLTFLGGVVYLPLKLVHCSRNTDFRLLLVLSTAGPMFRNTLSEALAKGSWNFVALADQSPSSPKAREALGVAMRAAFPVPQRARRLRCGRERR